MASQYIRPVKQADIETLPAKCALVSASDDPYVNLSLEEQLFAATQPGHRRLLLYSNTPCVVMGKHQNPWVETDPDRLFTLGLPLLRRISGGGTVFHDRGNLNYSFLVDGTLFVKAENLGLVRDVVDGIIAARPAVTLSGFGDLLIGGAKIGGIALAHKGAAPAPARTPASADTTGASSRSGARRSLHHGTVLVNADLLCLRDALRRSPPPVVTHAVASRPARVANLADFFAVASPDGAAGRRGPGKVPAAPNVTDAPTVASLGRALADAFVWRYGGPVIDVDADDAAAGTEALVSRHRSLEWLYGKTPRFTVQLTVDISNPDSTMTLLVDRGIVQAISGSPGPFGGMVGKYFDLGAYRRALSQAQPA